MYNRKVTGQELRDIQLQILDAIVSYCSVNGLTYFLSHGTLIGAIRHNGYIPWDDDIDIAMPRYDYEQLLQSFSHEKIALYSFKHSNHCRYPYTKAYDLKTSVFEGGFQKHSEYGVNIDIFPYDYLPNDRGERQRLIKKAHFWQLVLKVKLSRVSRIMTLKQNFIIFFGKMLLFPIKPCVFVKRINRVAATCINETQTLGCLVWGYGERETADAASLKATELMQFEDRQVAVPCGYDALLRSMYGSYWELPPVENQVTHHDFVAYWNES